MGWPPSPNIPAWGDRTPYIMSMHGVTHYCVLLQTCVSLHEVTPSPLCFYTNKFVFLCTRWPLTVVFLYKQTCVSLYQVTPPLCVSMQSNLCFLYEMTPPLYVIIQTNLCISAWGDPPRCVSIQKRGCPSIGWPHPPQLLHATLGPYMWWPHLYANP